MYLESKVWMYNVQQCMYFKRKLSFFSKFSKTKSTIGKFIVNKVWAQNYKQDIFAVLPYLSKMFWLLRFVMLVLVFFFCTDQILSPDKYWSLPRLFQFQLQLKYSIKQSEIDIGCVGQMDEIFHTNP